MASHPEIVEQAIAEARENDDIVSRSLVLNMIRTQKEAEKRAERQLAIHTHKAGHEVFNLSIIRRLIFSTLAVTEFNPF